MTRRRVCRDCGHPIRRACECETKTSAAWNESAWLVLVGELRAARAARFSFGRARRIRRALEAVLGYAQERAPQEPRNPGAAQEAAR